MTSPPSPPNRRRRRIVVVVTIAVLVLGLGWWFWPRHTDKRFVGKWCSATDPIPEIYVFKGDGTGSVLKFPPYSARPLRLFFWSTDGATLVMRSTTVNRFAAFEDLVIKVYTTATGTPNRRVKTYSILDTANGIELVSDGEHLVKAPPPSAM